MSTDIVDELRAVSPIFDHAQLCAAAADQIEHLRIGNRAIIAAVLHTIGGTVEGYPTGAHNFLQRLRELVAIEKLRDEAVDYGIKLQQIIEALRSGAEIPHLELHHAKIAVEARAALSERATEETRFVNCETCGTEGVIERGHPNAPHPNAPHPSSVETCPDCNGKCVVELEVEPVTEAEIMEVA